MAIAGLDQILDRALQKGYAVGYFEAWDQYSLEAVLEAAEEAESPAILGFGAAVTSKAWMDRWGVEGLSKLCSSMAGRSTLPTAALFNEARTFGQAVRGLHAGCNAVMLDTSDLTYEADVDVTRRLVEVAHVLGATVEADPGDDGEDGAAAPATVGVQGYAWSGGGRGVIGVDLSVDGGKTWTSATFTAGHEQPVGRAWAWTLWEADVPVSDGVARRGGEIEVVSRALDSSLNVQPESGEVVWNPRGILNNSYSRARVRVEGSEEE